MDIRAIKQSSLLALIEESTLLSYGQKLTLLEEFPTFTEEQMGALAEMLMLEEDIVAEYSEDIKKGITDVLESFVAPDENAVYVGVGRP